MEKTPTEPTELEKLGLNDEFNTNPKGDEMCISVSKFYPPCKKCLRSMECISFCKLEKIHYELIKMNKYLEGQK